jgi:hypothetical protein
MTARRTLRRQIAFWAVLGLAALLLAGGCSKAKPKVDEAALQRAAAEQARQAEEARKEAEQRRVAEEKRQAEELQAAFGPVGQPPALPEEAGAMAAPGAAPVAPGAASQPAAPAEIAFDDAVPPLPPDPTVRVVVLSHGAAPDTGRHVAELLGTWERERIEERLGMAVRIVYVAQSSAPLARGSEVHYRKDFLRAAQSVASAMFKEQWIGPMTADEQRQEDVDLVVHLGATYP